MSAPKGNKFWLQRSSHGRKPIFPDPETLWDAACEYFEWVEENPLFEVKAFSYQGEVTQEDLPRMRAMTISGLCQFLGIGFQTFQDYKSREGFSDITMEIESVIREQKFCGAAADLLNANIIARDLGLTDKTESQIKANVVIEAMTDDELKEEIERLLGVGSTD